MISSFPNILTFPAGIISGLLLSLIAFWVWRMKQDFSALKEEIVSRKAKYRELFELVGDVCSPNLEGVVSPSNFTELYKDLRWNRDSNKPSFSQIIATQWTEIDKPTDPGITWNQMREFATRLYLWDRINRHYLDGYTRKWLLILREWCGKWVIENKGELCWSAKNGETNWDARRLYLIKTALRISLENVLESTKYHRIPVVKHSTIRLGLINTYEIAWNTWCYLNPNLDSQRKIEKDKRLGEELIREVLNMARFELIPWLIVREKLYNLLFRFKCAWPVSLWKIKLHDFEKLEWENGHSVVKLPVSAPTESTYTLLSLNQTRHSRWISRIYAEIKHRVGIFQFILILAIVISIYTTVLLVCAYSHPKMFISLCNFFDNVTLEVLNFLKYVYGCL